MHKNADVPFVGKIAKTPYILSNAAITPANAQKAPVFSQKAKKQHHLRRPGTVFPYKITAKKSSTNSQNESKKPPFAKKSTQLLKKSA